MGRAMRAAAFGLMAAVVGFVVAPQVLHVAIWVGGGWMPAGLLRWTGHICYEAGLWFSGAAVWLVAQRLGALAGRRFAIVIIVAPAFIETAAALVLGRLSPALSTWTGFVVRVFVGTVALALGLWLTARPAGARRVAP